MMEEESLKQQVEYLQQQLHKQEKMASLGLLSAGIAHEVQNPLNFVINFSKMSVKLLEDLQDVLDGCSGQLSEDDAADLEDISADLKENLAKIEEHGERAISIIRGILLLSRGKAGEKLPTDIGQLVHEYVWLSYHAMRANDKTFNLTIREDIQENLPKFMVIPQDLSRAVLNVMNNACYTVWKKKQSAGEDYHPEVTVGVRLEGTNLIICIADNGEGMNEEVKQRLFENFFTTKPIGQGTGLGLGITRDIIENKHGGTISFESTEGEGSSFTFTLPVRK